MRPIPIHDPDDPRLSAYRCLKGKQLERDGIFIAEGQKVVKSMVQSGCRVASCLVSKGAAVRCKNILAVMARRKAPVYTADDGLIEDIIGFRFHKGIMAVGYCPQKHTAWNILRNSRPPMVLVALNGINDPQNVGLIARNAAAFGAGALIVDSATYDPYYRKAVRVSMGAIFSLPVCYEDDLAKSLGALKKRFNMRIIAATPGANATDITKSGLSGNICFVFGNEDKGVSRRVLSMADDKVRIPIQKDIDSLNVASASAVCLYEALRSDPGRFSWPSRGREAVGTREKQ